MQQENQNQDKINVISFSLYNNIPMYTQGMIKNIKLARTIYPGWKVWIYYDYTVSMDTLAEVAMADKLIYADGETHKMAWRFFPKNVDRFISRDADSRLSMREKLAVDEWIASGKRLHVMRDHPHHKRLMMGGMFGFIPKDYNMLGQYRAWADYPIKDKTKKSFNKPFLDKLFEKFKDDVLIHDSIGDGKPFPTKLDDYKFVGEIYDENDKRSWQYKLWINKDEK